MDEIIGTHSAAPRIDVGGLLIGSADGMQLLLLGDGLGYPTRAELRGPAGIISLEAWSVPRGAKAWPALLAAIFESPCRRRAGLVDVRTVRHRSPRRRPRICPRSAAVASHRRGGRSRLGSTRLHDIRGL